MPATLNLDLYGDDAWALRLVMRGPDVDNAPGDPIDLTGRTYAAQVRANAKATDVLVEMDVDTSELADGVVTLSIPDDSIRGLRGVWDLEEWLPGATRPTTLFRGSVRWTQDVTR